MFFLVYFREGKMATTFVPRMINLEDVDYDIVQQTMERFGLGDRGFSAAVRLIIRDWEKLRKARNKFLYDDMELEG